MPLFVPHRVRPLSALPLLAACVLLLSADHARAQQSPAQTMKLDRIEFKGLDRVKVPEALEKSGLQAGQSVDIDAVEAAANRLLESGLFANLSYKLKGTTDKALLTFEVVERKWTMPVAFDNFVWFTDDELLAAVRRKLPAFDGTAPEAGGVTEQIKQALEELLRERRIEGAVEYTLSDNAAARGGRRVEHLFSVKGPGLRVCKINYAGARAVPEETLVTKSGGIFDNDYSRAYVGGFVESSLLPLYHEKGYLRASFGPPKVAPETSPECKGVALSVSVDEGSIYVWDKAVWEGAAGLTAQELDAALGMRSREVANAVKIAKGLGLVRRAYGRKGYLGVRIRPSTEYDDSARSVSYRFQVEEGPQYRMGELTITGLDEAATNNLRGRWRLLSREVYDEGYLDEFGKKAVAEFVRDSARAGNPLPAFKIESKVTPDHARHTVDVAINFRREAAPAKP
ncbi:MAG TPA: POTRA domain-containing protein [Pyrinomonadaceae bacterium]